MIRHTLNSLAFGKSTRYMDSSFFLGTSGESEKSEPRRRTRIESFVKRAIDLTGASIGLIAASPVMVVIAALIRLDSRGPIFFRQERLGQDGAKFQLLKFRTMVVDAEKRIAELEKLNESPGGVLFKMKHDPRITPLGRFLRKTSLDELPQLVNVLLGQMSLVGPRPLPLRDCAILKEHDSVRFTERHKVLPGLTGPWQIGGRSNTGVEYMLDIDVTYVKQWSLLWDIRILFGTVKVVLSRTGAY